MRFARGSGSVIFEVHSGLPSVTVWTSVVAPPTSTTRQSPTASANSSAPRSTAPGVGRTLCAVSSWRAAMPGAWTMWRLNASWIRRRTGSTLSTSTSGNTLSVTSVSTPPRFQDLAHRPADRRVAGVEHRGRQLQRREPFGVAQDRALLAVVDAAGQQDDVGPDRLDLLEVGVLEEPGGHELDDRARAERGLARRPRGHAVGEPVDGHAQPAGRRAVDVDLRLADLHARRGASGRRSPPRRRRRRRPRRRWWARTPGRRARTRRRARAGSRWPW